MKKRGIVRHIGLSSHTPANIQNVMDEAPVDTLMFSVNPGYDYQKGQSALRGLPHFDFVWIKYVELKRFSFNFHKTHIHRK